MEERRKHKRLDLEVMVELERLDEESVTTLKSSGEMLCRRAVINMDAGLLG